MYKRILVPIDGSEQSEEALPLVRMLAKINKADIVLLRVVEYPYALYSMCYDYPPSDPDLAKIIQNKEEAIRREAKNYLKRIGSTLAADGMKVTAEVCDGPVVESILASIDRLNIDLIALSTCGQSGCKRCLIGAIANQVLQESRVPVILIRPTFHSGIPGPSFGHSVSMFV